MLNLMSSNFALGLRPSRSQDQPFIQQVFSSARPDLQYIDGEADLIESVIQLQQEVLLRGAEQAHPGAMHFIIEQDGQPIGVTLVDFGEQAVHIIFLAMLPALRGMGYGKQVLQHLQQAAWQVRAPLTVVVWKSNLAARQLYLSLGFMVAEQGEMADKLVWHPQQDPAQQRAAALLPA